MTVHYKSAECDVRCRDTNCPYSHNGDGWWCGTVGPFISEAAAREYDAIKPVALGEPYGDPKEVRILIDDRRTLGQQKDAAIEKLTECMTQLIKIYELQIKVLEEENAQLRQRPLLDVSSDPFQS